jgi:hypothetical protein
VFLENPLTPDGIAYTLDAIARNFRNPDDGRADVLDEWFAYYADTLGAPADPCDATSYDALQVYARAAGYTAGTLAGPLEPSEPLRSETFRPTIATAGPFEGERVDVLYFHSAYMNGSPGDPDYTAGDGSGVQWFTLTPEDRATLADPLADDTYNPRTMVRPPATFARLENSSAGFWSLRYLADPSGIWRNTDAKDYADEPDTDAEDTDDTDTPAELRPETLDGYPFGFDPDAPGSALAIRYVATLQAHPSADAETLADSYSSRGDVLEAGAIGEYVWSVRLDESGDGSADPRDADNLGVMYCEHGRYTLGDAPAHISRYTPAYAEVADAFAAWTDRGYTFAHFPRYLRVALGTSAVLPLYLIDHSGFAMRAGRSFADVDPGEWDSGQVGFICDTASTRAVIGYPEPADPDAVRDALESETAQYSAYLEGSVYFWTLEHVSRCSLEHVHAEPVDSCFGYLLASDADREYIISEARETAQHYATRYPCPACGADMRLLVDPAEPFPENVSIVVASGRRYACPNADCKPAR